MVKNIKIIEPYNPSIKLSPSLKQEEPLSTGFNTFGRDKILKLDRQNYAIQLRVMGFKYLEIYNALVAKYGNSLPSSYNIRRVYEDIADAMDNMRRSLNENTTQLIQLSTLRLDELESSIMPRALSGDLKAIDRVLRIEERRAKLHGLDKPQKIEVKDWRSELISLIEQGKITIEQVQQELGDDYARELSDKLNEPRSTNFLESGDVEEGSFSESGEQVA